MRISRKVIYFKQSYGYVRIIGGILWLKGKMNRKSESNVERRKGIFCLTDEYCRKI